MADGTWKASRVSADQIADIQVDGGVLLKGDGFDPSDPKLFNDSDILLVMTGSPTVNCVPTTEDFYADVIGVPNNSKQGKRVTGWDASIGGTALNFDESSLAMYLGSSKATTDGLGIKAKYQYDLTDYKDMWALFDMADPTKLFAVKVKSALNTGGLAFTTSKNGKGQTAFTLTAHTDASDPEDVPMDFYFLTKSDDDPVVYVYTAVEPVGTENPKTEGWYVLNGDRYVLTQDTEVDSNKTYYERTEET